MRHNASDFSVANLALKFLVVCNFAKLDLHKPHRHFTGRAGWMTWCFRRFGHGIPRSSQGGLLPVIVNVRRRYMVRQYQKTHLGTFTSSAERRMGCRVTSSHELHYYLTPSRPRSPPGWALHVDTIPAGDEPVAVETIGDALNFSWSLHMRCLDEGREGLKHKRRCDFRTDWTCRH